MVPTKPRRRPAEGVTLIPGRPTVRPDPEPTALIAQRPRSAGGGGSSGARKDLAGGRRSTPAAPEAPEERRPAVPRRAPGRAGLHRDRALRRAPGGRAGRPVGRRARARVVCPLFCGSVSLQIFSSVVLITLALLHV